MSLHDDLQLYYHGTYVTEKIQDGKPICPILVMGFHPRDERRLLTFSDFMVAGRKFDGQRTKDVVIPYDDIETTCYPRIGYTKISTLKHPVWFAYSPARRSSKGLTQHRLNWGDKFRLSHELCFNMFNADFEGRITPDLCVSHDEILYKGKTVGKISSKKLKLKPEFNYLEKRICQSTYMK